MTRNWDTIRVLPMGDKGYGDPLFLNVTTPFPPDPPRGAKEYNPDRFLRRLLTFLHHGVAKKYSSGWKSQLPASFVW